MSNPRDHLYTPLLANAETLQDANNIEEKRIDDEISGGSRFTVLSRKTRLALYAAIVVEALLVAFLAGMLLMKPPVKVVKQCPVNHYPQTLYCESLQ